MNCRQYMCPIWPAQELNLRTLSPKTNELPLDQLANLYIYFNYFVRDKEQQIKSRKSTLNLESKCLILRCYAVEIIEAWAFK